MLEWSDSTMPIQIESISLSVNDGTSMQAHVARPDVTPRAGILVFQEIFGVNEHIRDVTERFARDGYLAIAPELFHRSGPGFESGYTDMAPGRAHAQATTDAGLTADITAAHAWLQSQDAILPTAAIGYCMGGRVAALASMVVPLACSAAYYGGGIAPHPFYKVNLMDRFSQVQCPILFCWGGLDGFIKPEHSHMVTEAMRAAGKPFVSAEFSDADHGFFCDARASYNANAASEAWALTLSFFANHTKA
jgi:carboxymethylenebutenolidase